MIFIAALFILLLAFSAWRLRLRIERYFSFYARCLFALAFAYFILSPAFPVQSAWVAARIIMFCFACGEYIFYFIVFPYWPYFFLFPLVLLPPALFCSAVRSNALNYFRFRRLWLGGLVSPMGVAFVLIVCVEMSLVGIVVLLNSYIISPLFVAVFVVSLAIVFRFASRIKWTSEILRDAVFLASPVFLLGFLNLPIPRHPAATAALLGAIVLSLILGKRIAKTPRRCRSLKFSAAACALLIANGLAGISAGADSLFPWRSRWTLEEITARPGVELLTPPVEYYSCLLSPDGKTLYATRSSARSVSRIPPGGGKTITRPTEGWSLWMAHIPHSRRLAVVNGEAFGKTTDLIILDSVSLAKIRSLKVARTLHGLHYSDRLGRLYVQTLYGQPRMISLFPDTLGTARIRKLTFDMNFLYRMKGDDELDRLYLPDAAYNGTLHVLKMSTLETIARVRIGSALTDIAVAPERDRLYVACPLVSKIVVLKRSDLKKIGQIRAGARVRAVAFDPRRNLLYAGNARDATLDVFDADDGKKLLSMPAASKIRSIVIAPDGNALYFSSERGVFRVDLKKILARSLPSVTK